jgi:peptidoglycan/LPS O-acetylase OafA/YrhL
MKGHNLGLDAVRALAILLVIASHGIYFAASPVIQSAITSIGLSIDGLFWVFGIFGVELFFCLSGLLIGTLLLEIESNGSTPNAIKVFLIRRWMRTLPLYYLTVAGLIVVRILNSSPLPSLWPYLTLTQNIATPTPTGWFGWSWSLVIEEWSYILLPLIAFGILHATQRPVVLAAGALCIIGVGIRLALAGSTSPWDDNVRKLMLTRLDAIAYGVLLAWLIRNHAAVVLFWLRRIWPVALVAILGSAWVAHEPSRLDGFYGRTIAFPILHISFCALLPLSFPVRLRPALAMPVQFTAKISYALYLVHAPMVSLASTLSIPYVRLPVYLIGSVLLASAASYLVEQPIMRSRPTR